MPRTYQAEMILDDHNIANIVVRINTTGSVRDDEELDTKESHHAGRHDNFIHFVTLVVVEASAHANAFNTAKKTEDKLTSMARHGSLRKSGDILIVEGLRAGQALAQTRQTRAADNTNLRTVLGLGGQVSGDAFILLRHIGRMRSRKRRNEVRK